MHRDASGRTIHLDVAVPELHADVDAARVRRVVGNLLSNALKYSPIAPSCVPISMRPVQKGDPETEALGRSRGRCRCPGGAVRSRP